MVPADDLGFRRGLAILLFGIALELGGIVLAILGLGTISSGSWGPIGALAFFTALVGGFLALAGALYIAFPQRPV